MKTYKGVELFKAIMNFELKSGVKLRCIHSPVYGQGVEVDEREQILIWSDTKEPVRYSQFRDNEFEFEIIEEKEIEKINYYSIRDKEIAVDYIENNEKKHFWLNKKEKYFADKINELIDEINELKSGKDE